MENIINVNVLVFKNDDILFARVEDSAGRVRLTLPGAVLGGGENIEECALRGVKEATGLSVELDKKMSGVITRRSKRGEQLITFVFLAEAPADRAPSGGIFVPFNNVNDTEGVASFSKYIIDRLNSTSPAGMERVEYSGTDGREYLMYF
jgi:ADP-ribose pyrophosphatase YjhB (NUDIX family)